MKTFTIHSVRNVSAFFIALGLGYMAYTVSPSSVGPTEVEAVTSGKNVLGWAWSGGAGSGVADPGSGPYAVGSSTGIGWISFNSENETTGQAYGINISPMTGTGEFSGEAWAGNDTDSASNPTGIGWISFDRSVTGNPPSAPYQTETGAIAKIDWATGSVKGWARAIVACKDNNWDGSKCTASVAGDKAGGWDGWIKLSGTWANGVHFVPATRTFTGYAWGGGGPTDVDIVGWINFEPRVGGLPVNDFPQVPADVCEPSNTSIFWSQCDASDSCVSGGPVIQTNLTGGVEYGTCADGSTGSPIRECTAPTTTCEAGSGTWFTGDTKCSPGEPLTSPDCKPKTRFWQF